MCGVQAPDVVAMGRKPVEVGVEVQGPSKHDYAIRRRNWKADRVDERLQPRERQGRCMSLLGAAHVSIRRPTFRKSKAATIRQNQGVHNFYGALTDKTPMDMRASPARQPSPTPRGSTGKPLERDVQRAVLAYLKAHPAVAFAGRLNSGSAQMQDGRPIWFHTLGNGAPDIVGAMRKGCAWLAIEVKRPGAKPRPEQVAWLQEIADAGGCAGWVDCVEDAARIVGEWVNRSAANGNV